MVAFDIFDRPFLANIFTLELSKSGNESFINLVDKSYEVSLSDSYKYDSYNFRSVSATETWIPGRAVAVKSHYVPTALKN